MAKAKAKVGKAYTLGRFSSPGFDMIVDCWSGLHGRSVAYISLASHFHSISIPLLHCSALHLVNLRLVSLRLCIVLSCVWCHSCGCEVQISPLLFTVYGFLLCGVVAYCIFFWSIGLGS
jgi:hypothetical protein